MRRAPHLSRGDLICAVNMDEGNGEEQLWDGHGVVTGVDSKYVYAKWLLPLAALFPPQTNLTGDTDVEMSSGWRVLVYAL